MFRKTSIEVSLPHLKPIVMLPPGPAETLRLIIAAGAKGINSLELLEAGIYSTSKNVSTLRKLGGCIHTERKTAQDRHGHSHSAIAFYTYRGWK